MKNENFITIQGWMINELHLKGNELLIYATIYGFSQTSDQEYTGSLNYIAEWAGCSKRNVVYTINKLEEKGLITKTQTTLRGVTLNSYVANFTGSEKIAQGSEIFAPPASEKIAQGGSEKIAHNIYSINNNINNNNTNNIIDASECEEYPFELAWDMYGKKVGRSYCEKKWSKMTDEQKAKCFEHIPKYVASTPDIKYRKNFQTYLNQESYNDEIITNSSAQQMGYGNQRVGQNTYRDNASDRRAERERFRQVCSGIYPES